MLPFERARTLQDARESMESYIARCGWHAEFERIGSGIVTTSCIIRDASGGIVNSGYGKGHADVSAVGALYEAVEHHYGRLEHSDLRTECVPAGELHSDLRFCALPFLSEFRRQSERRLGCAIYEDFHSGAPVRVPLFLTSPHYVLFERLDGDDFEYASVLRYGSNSGTAIGGSFEEAAIHALNEIVERDAWSLFLLSHFMGAPRRIGRLVETDSLPDELRELVSLARERASGRNIFLIDITSDVGIPTFAATVDRILPHEPVYPQGFGTSTYPLYAAYRAVTELIQDIDFKRSSQEAAHAGRTHLEMVSKYPKVKDCVYFEVDIDRLAHGDWTYTQPDRGDLRSVLSDTLRRLKVSGIDACFNVHRQVVDTFCVVGCASMSMERFFLVSVGNLMGPGTRGRRLFSDIEDRVGETIAA